MTNGGLHLPSSPWLKAALRHEGYGHYEGERAIGLVSAGKFAMVVPGDLPR